MQLFLEDVNKPDDQHRHDDQHRDHEMTNVDDTVEDDDDYGESIQQLQSVTMLPCPLLPTTLWCDSATQYIAPKCVALYDTALICAFNTWRFT